MSAPPAGCIDRVSLPHSDVHRTVRYIPDWFPGTGWKAKAKLFGDTLTKMADVPHKFVKDQMVSRRSCRGMLHFFYHLPPPFVLTHGRKHSGK